MKTKEAKDFLKSICKPKFHKYIENDLAGDFAFHLYKILKKDKEVSAHTREMIAMENKQRRLAMEKQNRTGVFLPYGNVEYGYERWETRELLSELQSRVSGWDKGSKLNDTN